MEPEQIVNVSATRIEPVERWQNDRPIEIDHAARLAPTIERDGLLHPPRGLDGELIMPITGHHRIYAMVHILGWKTIPMILISGKPNDVKIKTWRFMENKHHLATNPVAEAKAGLAIGEAGKMSASKLAAHLDISPSEVTAWQTMLLVLTEPQLDQLAKGMIGKSMATWIASCKDAEARTELWEQAVAKAITRDQAKRAVQKINGGARKYAKKNGKLFYEHRSGLRLPVDTSLPFEDQKAAVNALARKFNEATGYDDLKIA